MLVYDRQWQAQYIDEIIGLEIDLAPHLGVILGNVMTSASIGTTLRIGRDLSSDYGPPKIQPSLPGSGFFHPSKKIGWYLFAGLEGRYVLHNIFLDGNTFGNSHDVKREPFVGDLQAGLVLNWKNIRISFTNIYRTDEFEGQGEATKFGSISLSIRL